MAATINVPPRLGLKKRLLCRLLLFLLGYPAGDFTELGESNRAQRSVQSLHRDLKPENILVTKKGHIKISDFGLSAIIDPVKKEKINNGDIIGTPLYMAPEIILQDPYDASVDWWALGVMVFTMLTGMMPFDAESEDDLFDFIVYEYPRKPDKETMSELSIDATELFLHLLEKYPQDRLGYKGGDYPCIRDHAFFHDFDWNRLEALEIDRPP